MFELIKGLIKWIIITIIIILIVFLIIKLSGGSRENKKSNLTNNQVVVNDSTNVETPEVDNTTNDTNGNNENSNNYGEQIAEVPDTASNNFLSGIIGMVIIGGTTFYIRNSKAIKQN